MKNLDGPRALRLEILVAIALTCVLVGMHVIHLLNAGPLWRDEISSLSLAIEPQWKNFREGLTLDPFPALFFVLLRGWHALVGDSDFALRVLGFLVGTFGVGAFWINARLTGRQTPIVSLLLLGFCPTLMIWGDMLRGYGLGVIFIVLSFGFFWQVIERPGWASVTLAACAAILSVQSLYTNSLLIFACGFAAALVALRRKQWKRAGLVIAIGAAAALSLVPYLGVINRASSWVGILRVHLPFSATAQMLEAALFSSGRVLFGLWILLALLAIVAALWLQKRAAFGGRLTQYRDSALYAIIAGTIALIATLIFFHFVGWGTNIWYYLPMLAIVAVSIDSVLQVGSLIRFAPIARAGLVLAGIAVSFDLLMASVQTRASNIDLIAKLISERADPKDLVVIYPFVDGVTFERYFHREVEWLTVPLMRVNLPLRRWDDLFEQLRRPDAMQPILEKINHTLQTGHNVWVASTFPLRIPDGPPRPVLPLQDSAPHPHPLGYFLGGWGQLLTYDLKMHAERIYSVDVPSDQPISVYEHSRLGMFSGWRDSPPTSAP